MRAVMTDRIALWYHLYNRDSTFSRPRGVDQTRADRVLEFVRLSRRSGDVVALRDLSVHVQAGALFGFVGSNGVGKTTTKRLALGVRSAGSRRCAGPALRACLAIPEPPLRGALWYAAHGLGGETASPSFHGRRAPCDTGENRPRPTVSAVRSQANAS